MTEATRPEPRPEPSRRALFAGAGAVGALAAAAALVPAADTAGKRTDAGKAADRPPGGYQLTEHVKLYYATARV
jgi:hypothetical protein